MGKGMSLGTQFTGYVQAQGGLGKSDGGNYSNSGIAAGARIEKKGTYLQGQVGVGTAIWGALQAGHEFKLNDKLSLDVSAKASAAKSNLTEKDERTYQNTMAANVHIHNDSESFSMAILDPDVQVTVSNDNKDINIYKESTFRQNMFSSWHPGESRVSGQAQLSFKSSTGKYSVGVEGGVRHSMAPNIKHNFAGNNGISIGVSISTPEEQTSINETYTTPFAFQHERNMNTTKAYFTPTFDIQQQFGKNSKFSFVANGDLYQGNAGIRYTF